MDLKQLENLEQVRGFDGPTPRPWKKGDMSSIVADLPPVNGCERAYGGPVVCEGLRGADAEFILAAVEQHERLVVLLLEAAAHFHVLRLVRRGKMTMSDEALASIEGPLLDKLYAAINDAPK